MKKEWSKEKDESSLLYFQFSILMNLNHIYELRMTMTPASHRQTQSKSNLVLISIRNCNVTMYIKSKNVKYI